MTILPIDGALDRAAAALRAGEAIVVPFPSPLPYVVAATTAEAVNRAKGRPAGQPCGLLVGRFDDVAPHLDLDADTIALAERLAVDERLNLFVPVGADAPEWLTANSVDGLVGITLAWLEQLRPLSRAFGHLYVSSANPTGRTVAVTAGEADAAFGGERLVLDGDAHRDTDVPHGSATIVAVGRSRALRLVREGVQSRAAGGGDAYVRALLG